MAGPFDRVPGVDHDNQLPLPVRQRLAANLGDSSTPEGAELSATLGPDGTAGNISKQTAQGVALVQALIFGGN